MKTTKYLGLGVKYSSWQQASKVPKKYQTHLQHTTLIPSWPLHSCGKT